MSALATEKRGRDPIWRSLAQRLRRQRSWVFIAPILVYAVLVLLGVTTSNIGIGALRQDPTEPLGLQIGASQGIRSDEWGTESPIWLGEMARHGAETIAPLNVSGDFFAQLPNGPVSAIVFFDGTALALSALVPDAMLFAAKWWLPTLLLFLGLPVLFRQVTGHLRWGYLAAVLIAVSPGTAWWSGRPINTLGFVAAGCALGIWASRSFASKRWTRGIIGVMLAGILLARTPSYYQPLAIVIAIPLVVATALFILWDAPTRRVRLVSLGSLAVSGALWTGLLFWENLDSVVAGLSTVYPGDRSSTGGALDVGLVFGATNLAWLEGVGTGPGLNQTEISSSFTVLMLVLAVVGAACRWRGTRAHAAVTISITTFCIFWLSWTMLSWGAVGAALPLINRVPNTRAMLGVGYLAILAFCMFMAQWRSPSRRTIPVIAASAAALVSGYAGSSLQAGAMPGLTTWMVWVSMLVVGIVVYLLVSRPQRWWTLVIAGAAATTLTVTAMPILFGLGDLRASAAAASFLEWGERSRENRTYWASTSQDVDSLMTAAGVPALSGRQQIGPDREGWALLDPTGSYEEMWNRGGLHVMFDWTSSDSIEMTLPVADTIIVHASPCTVADRIPSFGYAISAEPIEAACVAIFDHFEWGGVEYTVYEVTG